MSFNLIPLIVNSLMIIITIISLITFFNNAVVNCFNVETENLIKYNGPSNSMFGFSVALHRHNDASWVIVGAPESDETNQPGVQRPGAVYRCSATSEACQVVPFDRSGNNKTPRQQQIDLKSNQWFGATVSAAGIDGPIVACAPRYVWFSTSLQRRDPVGTCYVTSGDFRNFSEYAPCRTRQWGYHRQGSCQAGLGAAMARDGRRVYIGAPGSWYWQGQLYAQSLDTRRNVYHTLEGPASDDDSYLGYSVAVGEFGTEHEEGVAVGMPRGAELKGKVLLFTWEMVNLQNITGEQIGAYFGYAITLADVDGDQFDDLIIGAPMFTQIGNNEGKYENGRVYVIYQQSEKGMFRKLDILDGKNSKARFGLSLSSLDDINLDGYEDFAVGAPYDGEYEQGAVYIYHGSANGVRTEPSQVIYAQNLLDRSLRTFGFSVSGGIDLDNNEYPDLVVGAYESNKALLFRSRPVVKMQTSLTFNTKNKQISLDEKNCTLKRYNEVVPCTDVTMCMEFNGIGVRNVISLNVQYILDAKKSKNPRMFFLPNENNIVNETVTLEHSKRLCKNMFVFVKNGVRDKLTPLEAEVRYSLLQDRRDAYIYDRNRELSPVLDDSDGFVAKDSISIQKNCGPDNICIPDLSLKVTPNVTKYLVGSNEKLRIDVEVHNRGEDAFEAMFNMKVPDGVTFSKIELPAKKEIQVTCSAPSNINNNTLKCDIGNPLPQRKSVLFNVILELETKPKYEFFINVNTTNPEKNNSIADNEKYLNIGVMVATDFTIGGNSKSQDIITINSTQYASTNITEESQLGPQIIHLYTIRNNGPSIIEEAEVFFVWPIRTLDNDNLLYIPDFPETAGPIQCDRSPYINEYNLRVEARNSYLESSGIVQQKQSSANGIRFEGSYDSGSRRVHYDKGTRILTEEEKRRLDEDEFKEESGDASLQHIERTKHRNEAASGHTTSHRYETRWNSSQVNGGPVQTTSWSRNSSWITGPDGTTRQYHTYNNGSGRVNLGVGTSNIRQSVHYSSSKGKIDDSESKSWSGSSSSGTQTSQNQWSNQNPSQWSEDKDNIDVHHTSGYRNHVSGGTSSYGTHFSESNSEKSKYGHGAVNTDSKSYETQFSESSAHGNRYGGEISQGGITRFSESSSARGNRFGGEISQGGATQFSESSARGNRYGGGVSQGSTTQFSESSAPGNRYGGEISQGGTTQFSESRTGQHGYTGVAGGGNFTSEYERRIEEERRTFNRLSGGESHQGGRHYQGKLWTEEKLNTNIGSGISAGVYSSEGETSKEIGVSTSQSGGEISVSGISSGRNRATYGKYDQKEYDQNLGLGNAAFGRGFHTTALDLGAYENEKNQYDKNTGLYNQQSSSSSHYSTSQKKEGADFYGNEGYFNENPRTYSHSEHSSYSYKESKRTKREIDPNQEELERALACKATHCAVLRCVVGPLNMMDQKEAWVVFRGRVNATTIRKLGGSNPVTISTMMVSRITKLPYIGQPIEQPVKTHEVFSTIISKDIDSEPHVVPLWIVILSAVAGALILLLLIYLLYVLGFFKRNRPNDAPERQPLNRNGHYQHGDEQL